MLVCVKSPLAEMLAMFKVKSPALVTVTGPYPYPLIPTNWAPKSKAVGERVKTAAKPMPDSEIALWPALLVTVMDPSRIPRPVGTNFTEMVQLTPMPSEEPQVLDSVKSPVRAMLIPVRRALPVFSRVAVTAALVWPTGSPSKLKDAGESVAAVPLTESPIKGMVCGDPPALSSSVRAPFTSPVPDGEKATLIAQLAPGVRVAPHALVSAKGLVAVMLERPKGTLPGLVTVRVCAGLVVPSP